MYWPDGRREGLKKFPDVPVPFQQDIWANCAFKPNSSEIKMISVC